VFLKANKYQKGLKIAAKAANFQEIKKRIISVPQDKAAGKISKNLNIN
jgi:hypothetical protein